MGDEKWFSTKLRFVVLVESMGGDTLSECIFLLKASNFDAAFDRAIRIGHESQKEYRNVNGERVRWKFMEVVTLDVIPSANLDGCEVYSEPIHLEKDETIPFEVEFDPRTSKPIQTM